MKSALAFVLCFAAVANAEPLSLDQLVERARANDHRVREAQAQLRWFRAKYEEARWAWFPRIESYFAVAGPTPEARNDGLGGPPLTQATLMYDLNFGNPGVMLRAGAEAVLPIYTFGKLDALEEAGAKGVEAGIALTDKARDDVALQVTQAYWGYCLASSAKRVVKETLDRLNDAGKTLERLRKEESDQVTQMDVYKLEFYRQQAEVQFVAADTGARFAMAAIRLIIGAPPEEQVELKEEQLDRAHGTLLPLERYFDLAMAHRPELKAIEAGLAARGKEVFIRERMFLPDFGIAGFFRWMWTTSTTRQLSPYAYDPYNDLSAGLALVMRYTWDFPQKAILVEQARAEYEKMEHQRDLIRAGIRLEVEKAWSEADGAIIKADKQSVAERSARRWSTAAFASFDLGTGDTRELVDAFTALAAASTQRYSAFHDLRVGVAALSKAVGMPIELEALVEKAPLPKTLQPQSPK